MRHGNMTYRHADIFAEAHARFWQPHAPVLLMPVYSTTLCYILVYTQQPLHVFFLWMCLVYAASDHKGCHTSSMVFKQILSDGSI